MEEEALLFQINWLGPFAWPGFERDSGLESLPDESGVYLQTYPYESGFLIYAAGLTRRPFRKRFVEHTRYYLSGDHTVLDPSAIANGRRCEIWHGWGWTPEKRTAFEQRVDEIQAAARKQLASCRIFVAPIGAVPRVLERLEAAIMAMLYAQEDPFSSLPDRGMQLSPRWPSEEPIVVASSTPCKIHCLPARLEI